MEVTHRGSCPCIPVFCLMSRWVVSCRDSPRQPRCPMYVCEETTQKKKSWLVIYLVACNMHLSLFIHVVNTMLQDSKYFFWLQGLFWTNSTKSNPLVYILPLTSIFQRAYFVKFWGRLALRSLLFWACNVGTEMVPRHTWNYNLVKICISQHFYTGML